MIIRLRALRSLRLNYKRRGVWVWLKGRKRCRICGGSGYKRSGYDWPYDLTLCKCSGGEPRRGYQRILSEPEQVLAEQERAAAGAAT